MDRRRFIIGAATSVFATGCGVILYPERQNQERFVGQRLDGTVLALDGLLTLCFILPGVIAFAVDFATGTVYLPKEERKAKRALRKLERRLAKTKKIVDIETELERELGIQHILNNPNLMTFTGHSRLKFIHSADINAIQPMDMKPFQRSNIQLDANGEVLSIHT